MCQYITPKMVSILGVGYLDPGSGTPDPGLDRFQVILDPKSDPIWGPYRLGPRNTPKMGPFWVYFGVSSSTVLLKGHILYIHGMYRIGPD